MAMKKDITLSTGRVVTHERMDNGAWNAVPTTGPDELTEAEWIEYVGIVRNGVVEPAISSKRFGSEPYEHEV